MAKTRLIDRLPSVRGSLAADASLSALTWFRTGGPAEVLFRPADVDDLRALRAAVPAGVPVTVLGLGSNVLVRDGGIPGVVIVLGKAFAEIEFDGAELTAGAGALDVNVARACRDKGIAGLEFLVGIPGTVGGALRMNAGAYGRETSDVAVSAVAIDPEGGLHEMTHAEMGFSYRHSSVDPDWIFVEGRFRGSVGDKDEISKRMTEITDSRRATQPVQSRTGGSTFKNPATDPEGRKAWELIDAAGCRGLAIGRASVSTQHCNFLLNDGGATAADIESLGEEIRARVKDRFGVTLEWEIARIGLTQAEARKGWPE